MTQNNTEDFSAPPLTEHDETRDPPAIETAILNGAAQTVEAATPHVQQLTHVELLEVENLALKAQLVAQKKELFLRQVQSQIETFDEQLTELRTTITKMQKALTAKYGIDFTKQQIEAGTGNVVAGGK